MTIQMEDRTGMRDPGAFAEARAVVIARLVKGVPQDAELWVQFPTIIQALAIAEAVSRGEINLHASVRELADALDVAVAALREVDQWALVIESAMRRGDSQDCYKGTMLAVMNCRDALRQIGALPIAGGE